jgi:hypothetical protein
MMIKMPAVEFELYLMSLSELVLWMVVWGMVNISRYQKVERDLGQ